jgi:hypothetical protein
MRLNSFVLCYTYTGNLHPHLDEEVKGSMGKLPLMSKSPVETEI